MAQANELKSKLYRRVTYWVGGLLLSALGLSQVVSHEGLRTTAYPDPATGGAPWTICYGHTGRDVHKGLTVSLTDCERWLAQDLKKAQDVLTGSVRVPLQQGEVDAYTSFIYNVGSGNWKSSTLLKLLNSGDRRGACDQLPRWSYANGIKLEGIVRRRYEERRICLSGGPYVYQP